MEKAIGEIIGVSGPSREQHATSLGEGSIDTEIVCAKVDKFLDKEEKDVEGGEMIKVFARGSSVTDEEINLVVDRLGRTANVFNVDNMDKMYKYFLNIYGSIDGAGFEICGPSEFISDHGGKIEELLSIQKGFENRCRRSQMKAERVKSCWLVAGIDQGDEYFIDLSGKKKENIYSMSSNGKARIFAGNFLEFLDKFLEAYERRFEEEFYQKEAFESE